MKFKFLVTYDSDQQKEIIVEAESYEYLYQVWQIVPTRLTKQQLESLSKIVLTSVEG